MKSWMIAAIVVMASMSIASAQTGQQKLPPGWAVDPKTGCRLWNMWPDPGDSVTWSGPCKSGYADGHGVAQWFSVGKPTDRFEGDYRAGKEHGRGVYVWKIGDRYDGQYVDNYRTGQGNYTWADGRHFEGGWKENKAHGQGRFTAADGTVYQGNWVNGCLPGQKVFMGASREACGY